MFRQLRQSLITRLLIYFLFAGLLFTIFFGINIAHGLRVHFKQEILPNIAQYLYYIVQDIGSPPNLEKAQRLSDSLSFELAIQGAQLDWRSNKNIPRKDQLELEDGPAPYQDFRIAHKRGNNVVILRQQGYDFIFVIGRLFKKPRLQRNIGFVIFILLSMSVLFLLIRSSLKPVKGIGRGIQDIAAGELQKPIPLEGSMEFKNLAAGINDMALQIRSMLESKQQLLLAISHELRSPITRAKVNLELLQDEPVKQALLDDINEMQDLVGQILESERLNHRHAVLNRQEFALHELIESTISQFFANKNIETELDEVSLYADPTRLRLLIKNLLDNAIKYSTDQAPPPRIRLYRQGQDVILQVQDYGCGMDAAELEHITEAFYRVDPARQRRTGGVGLGLYLCQLVVTAHDGKLSFSSQPNQGTCVQVVLPQH